MAKFKISLLSPIIKKENDQIDYLFTSNLITSFDNNREKNQTNLTFNEQFKISKNAQKELSFDMNQKIWLTNEWVDNPFIHNLHIGSLLLLEDRYGRQHLMTINNIKYTFNDINFLYSYTCQDTFSYQLIKQQEGYFINNDENSEDFLGVKSLDEWAMKIKEECHIHYTYLPLNEILYQKTNNEIVKLSNNSFKSVKTIIKDRDQSLEHEDWKLPLIPFQISSANSFSALTSLGEQFNYILNTYEYLNKTTNKLYRYFWFEPAEKNKLRGLQYSPNINIENFGLDFNGDNLTTILDIESTTQGENEVTLLPTIPSFFIDLFNSQDWSTIKYEPNLFTKLVSYNPQIIQISTLKANSYKLKEENGIFSVVTDGSYYYIPIGTEQGTDKTFVESDFIFNSSYPLLSFSYQQEYSFLNTQNNLKNFFGLRLCLKNNSNKFVYIREGESIPYEFLNTKIKVALVLKAKMTIGDYNIFINLHRQPTDEELKFASIANKCPWLENKLIDFSYFLKNHIITKEEYNNLWDIINNDLRIANGKLLVASNLYFNGLINQTKTMADLEAQIDELGAICQSDIINPLSKYGTIKTLDAFNDTYSKIFQLESSENNELINYNEILNSYVNKYFNAEQRFLQKSKEFRDYFESINIFSKDDNSGIYTYSFNIDASYPEVSFKTPKWQHIESDTTFPSNLQNSDGKVKVPLYQDKNKEKEILIAYQNMPNLYTQKALSEDILTELTDDTLIDITKNLFFITKTDYTSILGEPSADHKEWSYTSSNSDPITLIQLTEQDLKLFYILSNEDKSYYYKDHLYYPFDWLRSEVSYISQELKPTIIPYLTQEDWASAWSLYKEFLPIQTLYYYGSQIIEKKEEDTTAGSSQQKYCYECYYTNELNEIGNAVGVPAESKESFTGEGSNPDEYLTYQPVLFMTGFPLTSTDTSQDLDLDMYLKTWSETNSNFPYYSLIQTDKKDNNNLVANASDRQNIQGGSSTLNSFYDIISLTSDLSNYCAKQSFEPIKRVTPTIVNNQWCFNTITWNDIPDSKISSSDRGNFAGSNNDSIDALFCRSASDFLDMYWYYLRQQTSKKDSQKANLRWEYYNYYRFVVATYSFEKNFIADYSYITDTNNQKIARNPSTVKGGLYAYDIPFLRFLDQNSLINKNYQYKILKLADFTSNNLAESDYTETNLLKILHGNEDTKFTNINSIINKNDKNTSGLPNFLSSTNMRINMLTWYILEKYMEKLDVENFNWSEEETTKTVSGYLSTIITNTTGVIKYIQSNNHCFIWTTKNNHNLIFLLGQVEDYERSLITKAINPQTTTIDSTVINWADSSWITKASIDEGGNINEQVINIPYILEHQINTFYNKKTNIELNLLQDDFKDVIFGENGIVKDKKIYVQPILDQDLFYEVVNSGASLPDNKIYYIKENNQYKVAYSFNQFKTLWTKGTIQVYYLQNNNYDLISTNPSLSEIKLNLLQTNLDTNTNNFIIQEIEKTLSIPPLTEETPIEICNNPKIIVKRTLKESFNNLTNGDFWYRYKNKSEWTDIHKECYRIENALSQIWQEALVASKYCKFFLPDTWLATRNLEKNNFFNENIIIQNRDISPHLILTTNFVPKVTIYTENNQTLLPTIFLRYKKDLNNVTKRTTNQVILKLLDHIKPNNKSLKDFYKEWEYQETSIKRTYYQLDSTIENNGLEWSNLLQKYAKTTKYLNFDGLYAMWSKMLINNFMDNSAQANYEKAKEEQDKIWNKLYSYYPALLLENKFTDSSATNSEELLNSALRFFKDQMYPEKNYDLSIINFSNLSQTNSETKDSVELETPPITIGDPIQLKSWEYYSQADDLFEALNQILFITDISYSLREDNNFKLTVNTIKYEDKLIQQLAKLIR